MAIKNADNKIIEFEVSNNKIEILKKTTIMILY